MIDYVEYGCLDQLRLNYGGFYGEYRFAGKYDRSFRHGVYIPREFHSSEIFQKTVVENFKRAEIFDLFVVEIYAEDIIYGLFETRRKRIGDEFVLAEEHVENGYFVFFAFEIITVHHREFVQIGEQRQVSFLHVKPLL